jgi:hypothetical protein
MREQPFQSPPASRRIIRSGESVAGGPIQFIGKDVWVKHAGGDLPEALSEWHLGEIASCQGTIAETIALAKELNDMNG